MVQLMRVWPTWWATRHMVDGFVKRASCIIKLRPWFLYAPLRGNFHVPAIGAVNENVLVVLSWRLPFWTVEKYKHYVASLKFSILFLYLVIISSSSILYASDSLERPPTRHMSYDVYSDLLRALELHERSRIAAVKFSVRWFRKLLKWLELKMWKIGDELAAGTEAYNNSTRGKSWLLIVCWSWTAFCSRCWSDRYVSGICCPCDLNHIGLTIDM